MNIQLISTKAVAIDLEPLENSQLIEGVEDIQFSFDFNPVFDDDLEVSTSFIIAFFGEMKSLTEQFECKVIYVAKFEVDEEINREFIKESFALINAPAIAYPYFRAFYSNLLLNAGYQPKVLPTVNFVQLRADKLKEMEERSNE